MTNPNGIGLPEEEEREKGIQRVFEEIIAENFHKVGNSHSDHGSTQISQHKGPKEDNTKSCIN